jgi:hypothetical protein
MQVITLALGVFVGIEEATHHGFVCLSIIDEGSARTSIIPNLLVSTLNNLLDALSRTQR